MEKLILIILSALILASCQKTYTCTTVIDSTQIEPWKVLDKKTIVQTVSRKESKQLHKKHTEIIDGNYKTVSNTYCR